MGKITAAAAKLLAPKWHSAGRVVGSDPFFLGWIRTKASEKNQYLGVAAVVVCKRRWRRRRRKEEEEEAEEKMRDIRDVQYDDERGRRQCDCSLAHSSQDMLLLPRRPLPVPPKRQATRTAQYALTSRSILTQGIVIERSCL